MIVSRNWLQDYVPLDMSVEELEDRLTMAGLNHEGTVRVGDDLAIDLEVTSNRPDCLGHIGVAREIAVLWGQALSVPAAAPSEGPTPVADLTSVAIECPELCYRYTARVIRGVKIGPSPDWLVERLTAVDPGYTPISNVVDITNYVLLETGQPLHAFDFARLAGRKIIVREARPGEKFEAIDHKTYELSSGTCVIADAERPVALGGVMGGADSEVSETTTDLLIESAEFAPLSIRTTARKLNLHSPSSFRFERGVDPAGVDWASRRCCEMILDLAGGELAEGVIDVGRATPQREPVALRFAQLPRVLGIEVPADEVRTILQELGNEEVAANKTQVTVVPPTWRRDLTREIDLIEEVARIHGYDQIPEDVGVAMVPSARSDEDRVLEKIRGVMTVAGFDEAMTNSAVDEAWAGAFSPWTEQPPLRTLTPVLRRADCMRRSLVPSLLGSRRTNESLANAHNELFEIAKAYLPRAGKSPEEPRMLALTSGQDYQAVKGVIEALVESLNPEARIEVVDTRQSLLDPDRSAELQLDGQTLGYLGAVSDAGLDEFNLRGPATVAELKIDALVHAAVLVPKHTELSPYPAVRRDLNVVFDEPVAWADVAAIVHDCGGEILEDIEYQDTYRDKKRLGPGKKSLLFSISLRSKSGTLTGQQADEVQTAIVDRLGKQLGGQLRAG